MAEQKIKDFDQLMEVSKPQLIDPVVRVISQAPASALQGKTPQQLGEELFVALKNDSQAKEAGQLIFANGQQMILDTQTRKETIVDKNGTPLPEDQQKQILQKAEALHKQSAQRVSTDFFKKLSAAAAPSMATAPAVTPPAAPAATPQQSAAAAGEPAKAEAAPIVLSMNEGPLASLSQWAETRGLKKNLVDNYKEYVLSPDVTHTPTLGAYAEDMAHRLESEEGKAKKEDKAGWRNAKEEWQKIHREYDKASKGGTLPSDVRMLAGGKIIRHSDGRATLDVQELTTGDDKEKGGLGKDGASIAAGLLGLVLGMAMGGDMMIGLLVGLLAFAAVSAMSGGMVGDMLGMNGPKKSKEKEKGEGKGLSKDGPAAAQGQEQNKGADAPQATPPAQQAPQEPGVQPSTPPGMSTPPDPNQSAADKSAAARPVDHFGSSDSIDHFAAANLLTIERGKDDYSIENNIVKVTLGEVNVKLDGKMQRMTAVMAGKEETAIPAQGDLKKVDAIAVFTEIELYDKDGHLVNLRDKNGAPVDNPRFEIERKNRHGRLVKDSVVDSYTGETLGTASFAVIGDSIQEYKAGAFDRMRKKVETAINNRGDLRTVRDTPPGITATEPSKDPALLSALSKKFQEGGFDSIPVGETTAALPGLGKDNTRTV